MNNDNLRRIKIWQQNTRKSWDAQQTMIHTIGNQYDVVCIQEPHFDFQNITRATKVWHVVVPTNFKQGEGAELTQEERERRRPRALMLIHKRISTSSWTQIEVDSRDVVAVKILGETGVINIYNIYNDCTHSRTLEEMGRHLEKREAEAIWEQEVDKTEGDIWMGDFNRHHPMWDDPRNNRLFTRRALEEAEILIDLLANYSMEMCLPKGIPTIRNTRNNYTRPDNVFCTEEISGWITKCDTVPEDKPPTADHFPIITEIDMPTRRARDEPKPNYRATDWEEFRRTLAENLEELPAARRLETAEELEEALSQLEEAVVRTVDKAVPKRKPSPYARRWWTNELQQARVNMRKANREAERYREFPGHSTHEEHRKRRNEYSALLRKTKNDHWNDWLENICAKTMWDAHRYMSQPASDGGKARIPALKRRNLNGKEEMVQDNNEKSRMFHDTFFFEPPNDTGIDPDYEYPEEAFEFDEITDEHIKRTARTLSPYKAPGLNGIANAVLTHCADLLAPYLGHIYRATFKIQHYPGRWKRYNTAVLRKQGRSDYTTPNAYRPIALLDVFAKLLSAIVKEILEYHTERLQLLPKNQFGGRPGCTTTDSLHMLVDFTKRAWRRGEDVVVVFLDVKGAFPNTVVDVLIHDMRTFGIPKKYTDWIKDKMSGRETVISFDDFKSEPIPVNSGLDQGCNLSMFFYRFYNARQIEGSTKKKDELATNYADDAMCATSGRGLRAAAEKMSTLFQRQNGPAAWARSHHSIYEFHKFAALGLTRRTIPDPSRPNGRKKQPPLTIRLDGEHTVTTTTHHKFLGVIVDKELRFKEHAAYALGKGMKCVGQIKRLSRTTKGMRGEFARRMYYAVVAPSMLYAADVWCTEGMEKGGVGKGRGTVGMVTKLERVQRAAALQATGALRTTPSDLLFAHADMPPMAHQITKICQNATLRLATVPDTHPLAREVKRASKICPKVYPSPLNSLFRATKINTDRLETIGTVSKHPSWKSPIPRTVAPTKEEALKAENENDADFKLYSDGSAHDGQVGAAAILQYGFRPTRVARYYLGPITKHTVHEAEGVGQLLAIRLLQTERAEIRHSDITLGVDSQSSIMAHDARKPRPGSHITEAVQQLYQKVKASRGNINLRINWIPGHKGIPGSEKVDEEAKKAAEGEHRNINSNFGLLKKGLPDSKSAARQQLNAKAKRQYVTAFQKSPRYNKIARIDPSTPSSRFRKDTTKLPKRHASILVQLRTGHVPLQAYLHRFKKAESPTCPGCGGEDETVEHYLRRCPMYAAQRRRLRRDIGEEREVDVDILGRRDLYPALFRYIWRTERFRESHGELEPINDK